VGAISEVAEQLSQFATESLLGLALLFGTLRPYFFLGALAEWVPKHLRFRFRMLSLWTNFKKFTTG
jgi:hypothetical protein